MREVLPYSADNLEIPVCPQCGEPATARLGERPGREVAEFWDAKAHVWFVRLAPDARPTPAGEPPHPERTET